MFALCFLTFFIPRDEKRGKKSAHIRENLFFFYLHFTIPFHCFFGAFWWWWNVDSKKCPIWFAYICSMKGSTKFFANVSASSSFSNYLIIYLKRWKMHQKQMGLPELIRIKYFFGFSTVASGICSRPSLRCILAEYNLALNEAYLASKFASKLISVTTLEKERKYLISFWLCTIQILLFTQSPLMLELESKKKVLSNSYWSKKYFRRGSEIGNFHQQWNKKTFAD